MRRVFLWAARNAWLKEHLPTLPFMQRAVRRFMPGETMESALDAAAPLQAAGIATMYTRLGENLDHARGGRRGRRSLPRVLDAIVGARDRRRGLGQADPARPRPRRGRRPRPISSGSPSRRPRPARTSGSTWRAAPTPSHDRPVRAAPGRPAADRDLPAGVPQPDRRRHRAPPAARPGDPAGQGRLRRAGRIAYREQAQRRRELRRPRRSASCSRAAAGRSGWASARTTSSSSSRSPSRSAPPASAATASRSRCSTASGRTSSAGWRRRLPGPRRSSPTARTGTRGTCAASPSDRPTCLRPPPAAAVAA